MQSHPGYVNVDGRIVPAAEASIGLFDHGLLYGDGLFETLRVHGGRVFRTAQHLSRLEAGARQLDLPLPWGREFLAAALEETAGANEVQDGVLRLTVTRGEGPPLPDPELCATPRLFVVARPATPDPTDLRWSAMTGFEHPRQFVPAIKSLCYLPFQQARLRAKRARASEALLSYEGAVVEGTTANFFVAREGRLVTPPLSSGCLRGVTREVVLELARRENVDVREAEIPLTTVGSWDEAFLTNSGAGIIPLVEVDRVRLGSGKVGTITERVRRSYWELVGAESNT